MISGAQNPANGCAIDNASCGQQGNFWDGSSGVPKSPLWNISEMQADELAYEKSMYGADSVVTGPNGWPAQNTSCRNHPRKSTSASLSSVSACPSFPMSKP